MASGYCMYCGTKFTDGHRFCMGCGRPLDNQLADMASMESSGPADSSLKQGGAAGAGSNVTSSAGSGAVSSLLIDEIFGDDDIYDEMEDVATEVYSDEEDGAADADPENELPTSVLQKKPVLSLKRKLTGTIYEMELPATVGRGSRCTVRVTGNRFISREHARIEALGDGYVITDHASANRTFVNGVELIGTSHARIANGDVIRLADEDFEFIVE